MSQERPTIQVEVATISNSLILLSTAKTFSHIYESFKLVHDQYCSLGYMQPRPSGVRFFLKELLPTSVVIVALLYDKVVGTVSGVINSEAGLPSSKSFESIIRKLCDEGRLVGEGTKFACKKGISSQRRSFRGMSFVSCQLIRWVGEWFRVEGVDDWIVIVNPRHRSFYEKQLGFEVLEEEVDCSHVENNPGVLLRMKIPELFSNKLNLPSFANDLFVKELLEPEAFKKRFTFTDFTVLLLLLDNLDLLQESSEEELGAFQAKFPEAYSIAIQYIEDGGSTQSALSVIKAFSGVLGIADDEPDIAKPNVFPLRTYVARLLSPLNLKASENGISLTGTIDDNVPDSLVTDFHLFGKLLVNVLYSSIISSDRNLDISFLISLYEQSGNELQLSVAFRAQNVCWHNQSSNILELLGGVIFRELSDLLVVHIPTLQFENLLVPFMYDKEEMAYEYFEDKISPLRILLIEDTLIAQKITCRRLMKKNHIVKVVENGVRALEILRHESFDLVIMDIQMPIMDGFETTIKIRERDEKIKAHTPIIALTAFAMPGDRERCFMCGMDDYVTKSSTEQELHDAIFRVMKKTTTDRQVFKKAS